MRRKYELRDHDVNLENDFLYFDIFVDDTPISRPFQ